YANGASGVGRQLKYDSLVYDGTQRNWVKEEIDLKQFGGKQIKIRFKLLSDGSVQKDGWYLDDISIVTFDDLISSGKNTIPASLDFHLLQNYPNPFNPETVIRYQVSVSGKVTLKIYDILGNEVATLLDEEQQAGKYSVKFDATSNHQLTINALSSGVYFYQLRAGNFVETKKMVLSSDN
ncbi:MAG: T9SS type A sorting domain-containing protein, partial [Candidatus Aquicultor sp.]